MTKAIEKKTEKKTFRDIILGDEFKQAMQDVLPVHLTADRMARVAITAMKNTPKLMQCTQESVFECLMELSQLGLEPDGRRAHLIPFYDSDTKTMICTLIVDYKGFVSLLMRTGMVSNIHSDIICENDEFEYDRGEVTKHVIDFKKPRGEMYAVYNVITMNDGTKKAEVMTCDQIDRIRNAAPSKNSPAWKNHYGEMAKKTVFRRNCKWVPLEGNEPERIGDYERVERAMVIDDSPYRETPQLKQGPQTLDQFTEELKEADPLGYGPKVEGPYND